VTTRARDLGGFVFSPLNQHALQPANHDDRQDNVPVLVGLELAAQAFGRFPDLVGEVVKLGLVEGKGHRSVLLLIS
jgi:predicted hotdog family 3-hydroxylacyl-ACP dehydratase